MDSVGIGLIGTGFIGKCHAVAYRSVGAIFDAGPPPHLEMVADVSQGAADDAARAFGFARATKDWRALARDPAVDVVVIAAPNHLHREMALAAIAASKHVHCEKPLALTAAEAGEMTEAAEAAGVRTVVGYNYLCNPAVIHAKDLIAEGRIGDVVYFRGTHTEDYMADPEVPFSWRSARDQAGLGALGDLGSHIVSLAQLVVGDVAEVCADSATVIAERPTAGGARRPVETEDQAHFMARFAGGAMATFEASRVAPGRKLYLGFEVNGTKGSIIFDQERMNELRLFEAAGPAAQRGFRTILTGPDHPDYGAFLPAPGHGLGFNDLKVIEAYRLLDAIGAGKNPYSDFRRAWHIERVLEAVVRSAETRRWVPVAGE